MSASKNWIVTLLVVGSALGLWACGQSVCARADKVNDELAEKAKDCASADGGGVHVGGHISESSCESGIKSCSSDDLTIMNKQFDCLEKVASCTKATENAWLSSVVACGSDVSKVTQACSKALTPAGE
jgi:hypothetical protein